MQSYIKIGGLVPEKNGYNRQTFVVLYIGCQWHLEPGFHYYAVCIVIGYEN